MSEWTNEDRHTLTGALNRVLYENRFWPDQGHHDLISQITPLAATEVAVVKDGKLLLQYRLFDEWPVPYDRPGWYIPGGYCFWPEDLRKTCLMHLLKDLKAEYKRAGVEFDPNSIQIAEPTVIGVKKWMPGDHPHGCPISLICVCDLLAGEIVETEWLKWHSETAPTDVPWHRSFQDAVHFYINSQLDKRYWLAKLQEKIDAIT